MDELSTAVTGRERLFCAAVAAGARTKIIESLIDLSAVEGGSASRKAVMQLGGPCHSGPCPWS